MHPHDTTPLKRCTRCSQEFPATTEYFNKRKGSKDGLRGYCRKCHVRYAVEWSKANPERSAENQRRSTAAYRARNRDAVYQRTREYKSKNPDKIRAYRDANRRNFALYARRRKDRVSGLPHSLTPDEWQSTLDYFNHRCAACGRAPGLFHTLAVDHWIPISNPACPGTVVTNAIPLCHGIGGCNNGKGSREPWEWLVTTFGSKKAHQINSRIQTYIHNVMST